MPDSAATNSSAGSAVELVQSVLHRLHAAAPRLFLIRVMFAPVPRDIDAPRDPDLVVLFDVVEKTLQRAEAARAAEQPAVHADRQHLRRFVAFFVKHVECVAQVREEVVRRC